eukprot:scaffold876_cov243-Pinguiococcus_pyrenoidosus.AAC.32
MPSGSAWIGAGLACWGGAKFCAGSAVHRGASYTDVGSQFTFDGDSGRGFDASAAAAATAAPATPGSSACWAVLAASTELQRAKASSTQLLHCDLSSVRLFTGASRVCEMMPLSSAKKRSASAALCATASSATARNLTTPTHSSWCSLIRMVSSARERSTSRASAASAGSDSTSSIFVASNSLSKRRLRPHAGHRRHAALSASRFARSARTRDRARGAASAVATTPRSEIQDGLQFCARRAAPADAWSRCAPPLGSSARFVGVDGRARRCAWWRGRFGHSGAFDCYCGIVELRKQPTSVSCRHLFSTRALGVRISTSRPGRITGAAPGPCSAQKILRRPDGQSAPAPENWSSLPRPTTRGPARFQKGASLRNMLYGTENGRKRLRK